uniref:hypothetical protein n=1 Tax=Sphingomonas bacterium TaxID=1895847 RepID=UPI002612C5B2
APNVTLIIIPPGSIDHDRIDRSARFNGPRLNFPIAPGRTERAAAESSRNSVHLPVARERELQRRVASRAGRRTSPAHPRSAPRYFFRDTFFAKMTFRVALAFAPAALAPSAWQVSANDASPQLSK